MRDSGKRLEVESLQGHAVRLGERHGIPTPMLFAAYALLRPYRDGSPGQTAQSFVATGSLVMLSLFASHHLQRSAIHPCDDHSVNRAYSGAS
jgi:hypothetical protein